MLDEEIRFFEESRQALLAQHAGRVALIKGRELIGVFDTEEQAISEGARQFGLQPFLVRRVHSKEQEVSIPALTLGILRANPTHTATTSRR